jgi:hypothetical protein
MQQEGDRIAMAFAINQQAIQASAHAAKIGQQMNLLQVEMQSMEAAQPPSSTLP